MAKANNLNTSRAKLSSSGLTGGSDSRFRGNDTPFLHESCLKIPLKELLEPISRPESIVPDRVYKILVAHWYARGLYIKDIRLGAEIRANKVYKIKEGDFVYNKLFAWKGSFAVATSADDSCYVSNEFPSYHIRANRLDPRYLKWYFSMSSVWNQALGLSKGGTPTSRNRLKEENLLSMEIPLPSLSEQRRIVARIESLAAKIANAKHLRQQTSPGSLALVDAEINRIISNNRNNSSWEFAPIPRFAEVNPSRVGKVNLSLTDSVSFVPMRAVDDVTGTIARPEVRRYAEVSKGFTWFAEGDVIFARITPCMQNGKAALARNLLNGIGFGSTEFHVMRPGPKISGGWLYTLVRHKVFRDDAATHFKGTAGQQRVPVDFLEQKVIPVPQLTEQRQIVAHISGLKSQIQRLKGLQTETGSELDALLPSVLDKAFKGGL